MEITAQDRLILGIDNQSLQTVHIALDDGANPELNSDGERQSGETCSDPTKYTASHMAVIRARDNDRHEIIEAMHKRGHSIEQGILSVFPTAESALRTNSRNMFNFIVQYYPNIYGPIEDSFTVCAAAKYDQLDKIKFLVSLGADVNKKDNKGRSAIMYSNCPITNEFLLQAGSQLNIVDHKGRTATWYAVQKLLLCARPNKKGDTPSVKGMEIITLARFCQQQAIEKDPRSNRIVKQLRTLLDAGLFIRTLQGDLASDNWGIYSSIIDQVNVVESRNRRKKLEKYLTTPIDPDAKLKNKNTVKI